MKFTAGIILMGVAVMMASEGIRPFFIAVNFTIGALLICVNGGGKS